MIALAPLGSADVRRLIEGMLDGDPVSDELTRVVYERTGGNPFAVEQLIGLLCDRGELLLDGGRWTIAQNSRAGVPPALRDSVLQRVGLLGADARRVVDAAAVLDRAAGERLIATAAGLAPARARRALCEALGTGIVREKSAGAFGFCHALAADAVHDGVAAPERAELHLRCARALERSPDPRPLARIAHHYEQARRPSQWVRYAELAAEALAAVGEDRDAARILQQALSAPQLARAARVRMAIKLGDAALYGRMPQPAIPILQAILQQGPLPPGRRGELRLTLAWLLQVARVKAGRTGRWREPPRSCGVDPSSRHERWLTSPPTCRSSPTATGTGSGSIGRSGRQRAMTILRS